MKGKAILAGVLDILKRRWEEAEPSYSAIFNDNYDKGRRSDPSYYRIAPGIVTDFHVLTHAEALQLVKEGAFGSLARVQDDGAVLINEHAQHAMTDFCSEVYSAWSKYQRRISEVERVCPALN